MKRNTCETVNASTVEAIPKRKSSVIQPDARCLVASAVSVTAMSAGDGARLEVKVDTGEPLGDIPQAPRRLFVIGAVGRPDEHGVPAHLSRAVWSDVRTTLQIRVGGRVKDWQGSDLCRLREKSIGQAHRKALV